MDLSIDFLVLILYKEYQVDQEGGIQTSSLSFEELTLLNRADTKGDMITFIIVIKKPLCSDSFSEDGPECVFSISLRICKRKIRF